MTANGEVQTREEATVYVKELDLFVTVMLLEETPAVLSLGKLCEDHVYTYHWTSGQKPHLTKNGKKIYCKISNYVPFVVPGLSTSSSTTPTPSSSSSSLQDSVIRTENPAAERSEITSEESPGTASSELLQDVPEWLQDFKENLVDKNAQPHQHSSSSSRELPMESRGKVVAGPGKHYSHFPKLRNCDICFRTKITRASCRRRTGTVVPKAENFWWCNSRGSQSSQWRMWITTQSLIRCCGTRFGNSVVTILPTQNKNFSGNPEEPTEVPGADKETKSHLHWQFLRNLQRLWRIILESLYVNTTQIRTEWDCWESSAWS